MSVRTQGVFLLVLISFAEGTRTSVYMEQSLALQKVSKLGSDSDDDLALKLPKLQVGGSPVCDQKYDNEIQAKRFEDKTLKLNGVADNVASGSYNIGTVIDLAGRLRKFSSCLRPEAGDYRLKTGDVTKDISVKLQTRMDTLCPPGTGVLEHCKLNFANIDLAKVAESDENDRENVINRQLFGKQCVLDGNHEQYMEGLSKFFPRKAITYFKQALLKSVKQLDAKQPVEKVILSVLAPLGEKPSEVPLGEKPSEVQVGHLGISTDLEGHPGISTNVEVPSLAQLDISAIFEETTDLEPIIIFCIIFGSIFLLCLLLVLFCLP